MKNFVKVKTSELTGLALDYSVALAEGISLDTEGYEDDAGKSVISGLYLNGGHHDSCVAYSPSTNWAQGGPIIEGERIAIDYDHDIWNASKYGEYTYVGEDTPLIAAMRCYVISKLGDEVEIPAELIE